MNFLRNVFSIFFMSIVGLSLSVAPVFALQTSLTLERDNGNLDVRLRDGDSFLNVNKFWWDQDDGSFHWTDQQNHFVLTNLGNLLKNPNNYRDDFRIPSYTRPSPVSTNASLIAPLKQTDMDLWKDNRYQYMRRTKNKDYQYALQDDIWQGVNGDYYQLGTNNKLWVAKDGNSWKEVVSGIWKGADNVWYKITSDLRLLVSKDGTDWMESNDYTWLSKNGKKYRLTPNGNIEQVEFIDIYLQENFPLHEEVNDDEVSVDRNLWRPLPLDMWTDARDWYFRIGSNNELWTSPDGKQWKESVSRTWRNGDGMYYKLDENLNLWASTDGNNWNYDTVQYWNYGDYNYRINSQGEVFFQERD